MDVVFCEFEDLPCSSENGGLHWVDSSNCVIDLMFKELKYVVWDRYFKNLLYLISTKFKKEK